MYILALAYWYSLLSLECRLLTGLFTNIRSYFTSSLLTIQEFHSQWHNCQDFHSKVSRLVFKVNAAVLFLRRDNSDVIVPWVHVHYDVTSSLWVFDLQMYRSYVCPSCDVIQTQPIMRSRSLVSLVFNPLLLFQDSISLGADISDLGRPEWI